VREDFVDADDARVREAGRNFGFAEEGGDHNGIGGDFGADDFDGDIAGVFRVAGAEDETHAAGPEAIT
jgi:hypothetical protein